MIERDELCSLIPHAGTMCLLDQVLEWDDTSIRCRSDSHRRADNPLRSEAGLSAVHLIEYGAQAAAVHGGLCGREAGLSVLPGFIAAIRQVELAVEWIHDIDAPLEVSGSRVMGDTDIMIYSFEIGASGRFLARGRVTVATPEPEGGPS